MKEVAIKAVRAAGEVLVQYFRRVREIRYKANFSSIVTEADILSEQTIIDTITSAFPEHEVFAEETGSRGTGPSEYRWIVDALDGTTNYVSGNRFFNISLALQHRDETILGIIHNPVTEDFFVAEKGSGLLYNGVRTEIRGASKLSDAVICVDWSHCKGSDLENIIRILTLIAPRVRGVRSYGSGALAAAHVAVGIFDAYFNLRSHSWDHAAASLIVQEAGGIATTVDGKPQQGDTNSILAANGELHKLLLECFEEALK